MVSIVGIGTGIGMMTGKALERVQQAQVIIGAARIIETYQEWRLDNPTAFSREQEIYKEYHVDKIQEIVASSRGSDIAVLVSGDTGFYSLADSLYTALEDCEVIPGISSVNAFFAKVKLSWQDAALMSVHGRVQNLVDTVRRNQKTFALTGSNIREVADDLLQAGFESLEVYVGSDLDTTKEWIEHTTVAALKDRDYSPLTVLLLINPQADASVPCGISDEQFIRGEVPMTKSEVRATIMSKLSIKPEDVCYDIGSGTGSVTVEMALASWRGGVIAIEKRQEGVDLIRQNLKKFHIGNTRVLCGEATDLLAKAWRQEKVCGISHMDEVTLPSPDVVFIGGSDGHIKDIMSTVFCKNPKVRMVVSAIALETLLTAIETFKELGIEPEIVQVSTARNRSVSGLNMMMAINPVYVLSGSDVKLV